MQKLFPVNEHAVERGLRIAAGVVLLAVAVSGVSAWGYIGVVPLITGILGSCPVYTLFGISTCPLKSKPTTI